MNTKTLISAGLLMAIASTQAWAAPAKTPNSRQQSHKIVAPSIIETRGETRGESANETALRRPNAFSLEVLGRATRVRVPLDQLIPVPAG